MSVCDGISEKRNRLKDAFQPGTWYIQEECIIDHCRSDSTLVYQKKVG